MPNSPNAKRNYKSEYKNYHGTKKQKDNRASRGRARYRLEKAGVVSKGDGKDVHHKNGNPKSNTRKNLKVTSKTANRSFPRTKTARKK